MTFLTIAAILFVITAILHIGTLFQFEATIATWLVAGYGLIYLIVGTMMLLDVFSWLPGVALVLTLVGGLGAITQLNSSPEMRSWTLSFIAIDIVLVVLLVFNFAFG